MFEQLDLLSLIDDLPQGEQEIESSPKDDVKIYIGCKIKLNVNEIDEDDLLYFEYYKPNSLISTGIVQDIQNGLFNVKFGNESVLLKKNELIKVLEEI